MKTDNESNQGYSNIYLALVRRSGVFWTVILLFLFLLPLLWFTDHWYKERLLTEQKAQDTIELHLLKNSLEVSISNRFGLLEGLVAFAGSNPTEQLLNKEFKTFTSGLYASFKGIRNFALAPGGIMRYVYPLKGNEKVPGHDLINDERPSVRADVQRTIQTRSIVLSGPYVLRQGGLGLVARKAVFVDDSFWGLAAMVIDLPPILKDAGFLLKTSDINVTLRDKSGTIFWGQRSVFDSQPLVVQIELPNEHWELAGIPIGGWHSFIRKKLYLFRAISVLIVGLLTTLAFVLIKRHQALIDSNERFHSLSDATFEGIAISKNGTILEANDKMYEMFGYQGEELIGMAATGLVTPESQAKVRKEILSGHEQVYEVDGLRKDNSIFPLEVQAKMFSYKGQETRVTALHDITKRKQAEETVKEKEMLYGTLFEKSISTMLLIDKDTADIVDANPSACAYYGHSRQALLNMKITDINILSEEEIHNEMKKAQSEQKNYFNFRHRLSNGSIRDVEVFSGPLIVGGNSLLCSIINDISERKIHENERERLIDELQKALDEIKTLEGIVPICSSCKKIRDDKGYWNLLELYIEKHSDASFSHGICPECSEKLYGKEDWYLEMKKKKTKDRG